MPNDTETNSAPAPAPEKKKAKVSNRYWIGADGKEVTEVDDVVGFRYESVSEPGANVEAYFTGDAALPAVILNAAAAFGLLTLAGNVTNVIRNGEPKADGPQTEKEALEKWIADLREGNWTRPSGDVDPGLGLLSLALARHFDEQRPLPDGSKRYGNDEHQAKVLDWLKGLDKETKAGWRADLKVKAHLSAIKSERAAANAAKGGGKSMDVPTDI